MRAAGLLLFGTLAWAAAPDLVIQVVRGSGANNNAVLGNSASPVVRVMNSAGMPVPGVLVVFTAPAAGPSVDFAGEGPIAQALTDDSGTVAAPRVRPVIGDGQVEIRVLAVKDGKSANASILQMNLGVENRSDSQEGMEISAVPLLDPGPQSASKPGGRRRFRFRVENGTGKPIGGVPVQLTVQAIKRSGKAEDLDRFQEVSAADGTVLIIVDRNTGRSPIEITAAATLNNHRATRYFTFEE